MSLLKFLDDSVKILEGYSKFSDNEFIKREVSKLQDQIQEALKKINGS